MKTINHHKGKNESGSAALVAILFVGLAALTVLAIGATSSFRNLRTVDQFRTQLDEKWQARSEASILSQTVRNLALPKFTEQLTAARTNCGGANANNIPPFDPQNTTSSRPMATITNGNPVCTGNGSASTSVFGVIAMWASGNGDFFGAYSKERFGTKPDNTKVIEMTEIFRRMLNNDPANMAYAVRYTVESKTGNYRTRTSGEFVLGGDNVKGCLASATLTAVPSTVVAGSPVTLNITYSTATKIEIYNGDGQLINEATVTDSRTPQVYTYTFTPTGSSGNYYAVAKSSGGCSATTAIAVVTVNDKLNPVCPTITTFSSSPASVPVGGTVTISWSTANADGATLQVDGGAPVAVPPSGSQTFTVNNPSMSFILRAKNVASDIANKCPAERTITVSSVPASCGSLTPPDISFSANPTSVGPGAASTLSWTIANLTGAANGTLTDFSNAPIASNLGNGASSQGITLPNSDGNYTYSLTASNTCSDGTVLSNTKQATIAVNACPPAVFNSFTANPSTVTTGENRFVTLSWNGSGSFAPGSVSISNGVGTGFDASGSVDITQPQVTTTYTISGTSPCGNPASMNVTVTVTSCPVPVINSFTASPSAVQIGGNQTVRLSWNVSGTVESLNISGIGTVTGNFVDIPQPQVPTEYTLTATGCGNSPTRIVRITVTSTPNSTSTYSCPAYSGSETVCRNTVGCGNVQLNGSVNNDGTTVSGALELNEPFGYFNFRGLSFSVTDAAGRQLATGAVNVDANGNVYTSPASPTNWKVVNRSTTQTGGSLIGIEFSTPTLGGAPNPEIIVAVAADYVELAGGDPRFSSRDLGCGGGGGGGGGGNSCTSRTDTAYYCDANTNTRFVKSLLVDIQAVGSNTYTVSVPQPEFAPNYTSVVNSGSYRVTTSQGVSNVSWSNSSGCGPTPNNYCYDANGNGIGGRVMPTGFTVTSTNGVNVAGNYFLYRGDGCDAAGDRNVSATFEADTNNCIPEMIIGANYSPFNAPGIMELALNRIKKTCGTRAFGFFY